MHLIITIALVSTAIAYVLLILYLRIGLERADKAQCVEGFEPTVSIIVAARNEELYIADCVTSLSHLDYPSDKLEIIVVNDGSSDRTREIAESYKPLHPHIRVITTTPGEGNLRGKTNAVAQGIDVSSGEILMFTDADCVVPAEWVRNTVKYFDEKTAIVGGFTLLEADGAFEGMQTLDWIFLFGLASAMAGWKRPLTVIGNNLSVRRSAYDLTGSYRKIPFSVTEDYALVHAIVEKTCLEVRFPINPKALVRSKACKSWNQLYRQKQRWGVGGLDMTFRSYLIMSIGWAFKLSLILSIFYSPAVMIASAVAAMSIVESRFLWKPLRQFGSLGSFKYLIAFELYFALYTVAIPFIALISKKVVWKERHL